MTPKAKYPVIVVTGLSGAGKSTALKVFEDLGFFCVDGLPASMVPKLVNLFTGQDQLHRGLAVGMDLRQLDFAEAWNEALEEMRSIGVEAQIVFLDARLETLVRRYAMTRRPHPLESTDLGLDQALDKERILLESIRRRAALVVDTTDFSIHDLRRIIQDKWSIIEKPSGAMRVHLISFGFKYGVPIDADLVFDLRFLPNPYFDETLRPLSGKDKVVADYVYTSKVGRRFKKRFLNFVTFLLPLYAEEGRYRVTLALGCTGGRHRSVATAEMVHDLLKSDGYTVTLEHRHFELG